jgi:hypothetical protein
VLNFISTSRERGKRFPILPYPTLLFGGAALGRCPVALQRVSLDHYLSREGQALALLGSAAREHHKVLRVVPLYLSTLGLRVIKKKNNSRLESNKEEE